MNYLKIGSAIIVGGIVEHLVGAPGVASMNYIAGGFAAMFCFWIFEEAAQ